LNYKKLLIYLTPTGRKPSAESISSELKKNLKEKRILHCLSYLDIKEWLNRANDKVEATKVKVLLNQYVEIASEIGGETIMAGIQGKYTDLILKNDDYFRMAIELSSVTEKAKKKLAIEFLHKMIPVFQKELGEEWKVSYYGEGIGVDFRKIVWSRTYHHIDFDGCNFSIGVSNNEDKPLLKEGWCDKQEFINFAVNYDLRDCKSGDTWLWQAYTYGKYNIELKMPCVDNLIKYKNSDSDLMLYYVDCMRVLIDISTPLINKLESRRLG
jgi:PII-like signaling protein